MSSNAYSSPYGVPAPIRGTGQYGYQASAEEELARSERSYDETKHELDQAIFSRQSTPRYAHAELHFRDREVHSLQQKLQAYEAKVKELQDQVEKQKITIRTQSHAIQNPRPRWDLNTPTRPSGQSWNNGNTSAPGDARRQQPPYERPSGMSDSPHRTMPPPAFQHPGHIATGPRAPPLQSFRPDDPFGARPAPRQASRGVYATEWGSPQANVPSANPQTAHSTQNSSSSGQTSGPSPSKPFQQYPTSSTVHPHALVKYSTEIVPPSVSQGISKIFDMAKTYAFAHANVPSTAGDEAMPKSVKKRLIKAASSNTAFTLMSHPATRYFLVAKVISQWLIKHVFRYDSFKGFDKQADETIESSKNQIYQSTPAQVRYLLLNVIAQQFTKIKTQPQFQAFCESLSRDRGNELWPMVRSMMHKASSCDWEDLYHLVLQAHNVTLDMYTGAEEYRFDFAEIGQRFNKETMQCVMKHLEHLTPEELERQAVVTLGITPCVTVRSNSKEGMLATGTIAKGMVLVKLE